MLTPEQKQAMEEFSKTFEETFGIKGEWVEQHEQKPDEEGLLPDEVIDLASKMQHECQRYILKNTLKTHEDYHVYFNSWVYIKFAHMQYCINELQYQINELKNK